MINFMIHRNNTITAKNRWSRKKFRVTQKPFWAWSVTQWSVAPAQVPGFNSQDCKTKAHRKSLPHDGFSHPRWCFQLWAKNFCLSHCVKKLSQQNPNTQDIFGAYFGDILAGWARQPDEGPVSDPLFHKSLVISSFKKMTKFLPSVPSKW